MYGFYFALKNLIIWDRSEIEALPWSFMSKITNYKHQISNKPACHCKARAGRSQITNHKFKTGSTRSAVAYAA